MVEESGFRKKAMCNQEPTRDGEVDWISSALWTKEGARVGKDTGEGTMSWGRAIAGLVVSSLAFAGPAVAQSTFYVYRCADGSRLAVALFDGDSRAHIQLNGKALTLPKRLALSGTRYSASGVTLRMTKDATTLKNGRLPLTTCTAQKDW
jgi:membrane-bound inhibitor of C-type lysozyme